MRRHGRPGGHPRGPESHHMAVPVLPQLCQQPGHGHHGPPAPVHEGWLMGLLLVLLGIVLWLLVNSTLGIFLIVVGIILLFVPHTWGYTDWRGRRGPPA